MVSSDSRAAQVLEAMCDQSEIMGRQVESCGGSRVATAANIGAENSRRFFGRVSVDTSYRSLCQSRGASPSVDAIVPSPTYTIFLIGRVF
jgi:hypothetical protein